MLRKAGFQLANSIPLVPSPTLGKRHLVTFATDAPHGFNDDHIAALGEILPALPLVSEIRLNNQLARTLLETYVVPTPAKKSLPAPPPAAQDGQYDSQEQKSKI